MISIRPFRTMHRISQTSWNRPSATPSTCGSSKRWTASLNERAFFIKNLENAITYTYGPERPGLGRHLFGVQSRSRSGLRHLRQRVLHRHQTVRRPISFCQQNRSRPPSTVEPSPDWFRPSVGAADGRDPRLSVLSVSHRVTSHGFGQLHRLITF